MKDCKTRGLANTDSPFYKQMDEIEEEMQQEAEILARSGTTVEEITENLNKIAKVIIEEFKPRIELAIKAIANVWDEIAKAMRVNPEVRKCYGIYKRTKSRRIKKKQKTRINKIIKKEIQRR